MAHYCEDFPCCGHGGDEPCPDPEKLAAGFLPYNCLECGNPIKREDAAPGHESFHARCLANIDWDAVHDRGDW